MHLKNHPASALIILLASVTLVTVLVVSLLVTVRNVRTDAGVALSGSQAELLSDLAADVAIARMRDAIDRGRIFSSDSYTTWASEPGRIHRFTIRQSDGHISRTETELFSALPGPDHATTPELNQVDLNRPNVHGVYPVTGSVPGTMKVGWTTVLQKPDEAASQSNPPIGRIAWWVDDESCKVNINVADGSKKEDLYRTLGPGELGGSFGFGTPTEINLEALIGSLPAGSTLSAEQIAAAIAEYGWNTGFNTTEEVNRVSGLPDGFYNANRFNITVTNKSPDETFYGEPKIALLPMFSGLRTPILGPTHVIKSFDKAVHSGVVDFIYPTPRQLPLTEYQEDSPANDRIATLPSSDSFANNAWNNDLNYLKRIARSLKGIRSDFSTFHWPAFPGSTGQLHTKYNARQIDSIALQIYDISHRSAFPDSLNGLMMNHPSLAPTGIINTGVGLKAVSGLARGFLLNEIVVKAEASEGSMSGSEVALLKLSIGCETHFPEGFKGHPLHGKYTKSYTQQWSVGYQSGERQYSGLNCRDAHSEPPSTKGWGPSALGTYWQNTLLRVLDHTGSPAGIDLFGQVSNVEDKDQGKAEAYHQYTFSASDNHYKGAIITAGTDIISKPALHFLAPFGHSPWYSGDPAEAIDKDRSPGTYQFFPNRHRSVQYPTKPYSISEITDGGGFPSLQFQGGFQFWSRTSDSNNYRFWEFSPIDSIRDGSYTSEVPATIIEELKQAVIPVSFSLPIPGSETYHVYCVDPWVNKFPRDWIGVANPREADSSFPSSNSNTSYRKGGSSAPRDSYFEEGGVPLMDKDGANPGFSGAAGGDPLSLWLPRVDTRYPKQSRFPSVGALNYVRTGMIPDNLSVPISNQRGVPFRSINFSKTSTASQQILGVRYPDWAMLDLFTVPFIPQKIYFEGEEQKVRRLTRGGATEGRMNINNPRIPYPFSLTIAEVSQTPPERTAPLEALFKGIKISRSYEPDGTHKEETVDAKALREGVQAHIEANGPFMIPGQLAEVTSVDNCAYTSNTALTANRSRSRNDLLRQVVGATTTQSNTYAIWAVAQTFKKSRRNTDFSKFEPGDIVTGEVRRRYLVERFIELGKDGVPGNAEDPGPDGIVGTFDDVVDTENHPAMTFPLPYRWRIVSVEEFH